GPLCRARRRSGGFANFDRIAAICRDRQTARPVRARIVATAPHMTDPRATPRPSLMLLFLQLGSLLRLAPSLAELDRPFAREIQLIPVLDRHPAFPYGHFSTGFEKQRLRFRVFFLPRQAGPQKTLRAETFPVVRAQLAIDFDGLARKRFAFGELSLRLVRQ